MTQQPDENDALERSLAGLREQLGLPQHAEIDPARVVLLAGLLADCVLKLNGVTWRTWEQISPRKGPRGNIRLQKTLGEFCTPGGEMAHGAHDIEQFRKVVAGLVSGIKGSASEFAKLFLDGYSPGVIEGVVREEGVRWHESKDTKCWRKYQQLTEGLSKASIERELLELVAATVIRLADTPH